MNASQIETAAHIATVIGTVIVFFGFWGTVKSIKENTKSRGLNSLFLLQKELGLAEASLLESLGKTDKEKTAFVTYLNLLETIAASVNSNFFGRKPMK